MKCLSLLLLLLMSNVAIGKEVYYGSGIETINIGSEMVFRFHQQVRTISQAEKFEIKPVDENDPDYSTLSIRPRFSTGESDVVFVLTDGSLVNLKLRIVSGTKGDPFIDLIPKSQLIERTEKNLPVITVTDFMKSLDMDAEIVGYKRLKRDTVLNTKGIAGVRARLIREYQGKDYTGFVIEISNKFKNDKFAVNPENLEFKEKGIALITLSDTEMLNPKETSFIKVVAKPAAQIRDIKLPLSLIKVDAQAAVPNGVPSELSGDQ